MEVFFILQTRLLFTLNHLEQQGGVRRVQIKSEKKVLRRDGSKILEESGHCFVVLHIQNRLLFANMIMLVNDFTGHN